MKKHINPGTILTIVFTCIIVLAGYFSVTVISAFIPSFRNQLEEIKTVPENYILNFSDSDMGLSPFQWDKFADTQGVSLDEKEQDKLMDTYVQEVMYKLLYRDILQPDVTIKQLNIEDQSLLYDKLILNELNYKNEKEFFQDFGEYWVEGQEESFYIYVKTVKTKTTQKTYEISCVMDRDGNIWSYHCNVKEKKEKFTDEIKENAYYYLADMVSRKSSIIIDNLQYMKYLNEYYGQPKPGLTQILHYFIDDAYEMLDNYQIITTDTELLLVFNTEKPFILCFDPILYQFTGVYFE